MNQGHQVSGEVFVVPSEWAVPYPAQLSNAEACSIWVQYLTAYYPLAELTDPKSGGWVLVTAGASSAGAAALEICRALNIKTIATTRSEDQVEYIYGKGATKVVIPTDDFAEQIREITGGEGVSTVYDCVGDPLLGQYAHALAKGAQVFLYGRLDATPDLVPLVPMIQAAAVLRPYSVYHHIYDPVQRERGIKFVTDLINSGELHPEVDRVFPLDEFKEAWTYLADARKRRGKVVISVGASED
jgi:NADPH:quinone reductase-like Zn-dependent oxidoreductase